MADVKEPRQAVTLAPAFIGLQAGVASMLDAYERGNHLAGEAAKAIVLWLISDERGYKLSRELNQLAPQVSAIAPDIEDILHRELGLPSDDCDLFQDI